jgi:hypothetical protein
MKTLIPIFTVLLLTGCTDPNAPYNDCVKGHYEMMPTTMVVSTSSGLSTVVTLQNEWFCDKWVTVTPTPKGN